MSETTTLWFDSYTQLHSIFNVIAARVPAVLLHRAAGLEQIVFEDGTRLRFCVRTKKRKEPAAGTAPITVNWPLTGEAKEPAVVMGPIAVNWPLTGEATKKRKEPEPKTFVLKQPDVTVHIDASRTWTTVTMGGSRYTAVGSAKRCHSDEPNDQRGLDLAHARALREMADKLEAGA